MTTTHTEQATALLPHSAYIAAVAEAIFNIGLGANVEWLDVEVSGEFGSYLTAYSPSASMVIFWSEKRGWTWLDWTGTTEHAQCPLVEGITPPPALVAAAAMRLVNGDTSELPLAATARVPRWAGQQQFEADLAAAIENRDGGR